MGEADERAISWAASEGETIKGPQGGPLTFKVRGECSQCPASLLSGSRLCEAIRVRVGADA